MTSVALTSAQAGRPDPHPVADHVNCIGRGGYAGTLARRVELVWRTPGQGSRQPVVELVASAWVSPVS